MTSGTDVNGSDRNGGPTLNTCNVTVVRDRQRLDVSLPVGVPLADMLPTLLGLFTADRPAEDTGAWVLSPLGGAPLEYAATLADADIADGAVLLLTLADQAPPPARLEHLIDVIIDHIDSGPGRWNRHHALELVTLGAAAIALTAQLTLPSLGTSSPGAIGQLAMLTILLAAAAVVAAPRRDPAAVAIAAPLGAAALVVVASATAAQAVRLAVPDPRITLTVAVAAGMTATTIAVLARSAHRTLDAPAWLIAAAAAPLGAAWTLQNVRGASVAAFAGVLIIGALPRIVAGAGGLAAVEYRLRHTGRVPPADVTAAVDRSATLLTWALTGLCAAIALLAIRVVTLGPGATWPSVFVTIIGAAMLIRARLFTRTRHVLPPAAAGAVVLAAVGLGAVVSADAAAQYVALSAFGVLTLIATATIAAGLRTATAARIRLLTGVAEAVLVAAAVPVLAVLLGVFDAITGALR